MIFQSQLYKGPDQLWFPYPFPCLLFQIAYVLSYIQDDQIHMIVANLDSHPHFPSYFLFMQIIHGMVLSPFLLLVQQYFYFC